MIYKSNNDRPNDAQATFAGMNTCVCCGAPVPEGRMVCWACENGFTPDKRRVL